MVDDKDEVEIIRRYMEQGLIETAKNMEKRLYEPLPPATERFDLPYWILKEEPGFIDGDGI